MNAPQPVPLIGLDMPFTVTVFPNYAAQSCNQKPATINGLMQQLTNTNRPTKDALPMLKLASFGKQRSEKGSLRHNANILDISGIEADYDGGKMSIGEARARVETAGILSIVYTTPSHTEDAPRWRVLCPLSVSAPPENRTALLDRVNGVLGGILAPESWTLSQAYYFGSVNNNPSHVVHPIDGMPIDMLPGLDAGARRKPGSEKENSISYALPTDRVFTSSTHRLDAWRERILDNVRNATDGEKHTKLIAAARTIGGYAAAAGWTDADLLDLLMAALPASVKDWSAAKATALDGLTEGRKKPLTLEDRPRPNARPRPAAAALDHDPPDPTHDQLTGFDQTEDGIGLAFVAAHRAALRYDNTRGAWFKWTGAAWRQDKTKLAFSWARRICREQAKGSTDSILRTLAKASTAAAVERLASSDQDIVVTSEVWDSDPFLLGTPGGTVDLKTAEIRPADPADHITKLTAVAPSEQPDCPQWLAFLEQVTNSDTALVRFLKQWCGYSLTGDTREHALAFVHGPGGNGKSVFVDTIAFIMGDYATEATLDAFTASPGDKHSTDMAMLDGARLVTVTETEEGRAWAEAKLKTLTGGGRVTARFMRQDNFTYTPQFKLTISGNHKPQLKNIDEAMRRRLNLVPFNYAPPVKDMQLVGKLRTEAPGILRWMIEGCIDWQMHGLIRPPSVVAATAGYFSEQDTVKQWIEENCLVSPRESDTSAVLFKSWSDYATAAGEKANPAKWFGAALERQGFESVKNTPGNHGKRGFKGISVRRDAPPGFSERENDQ